MGLLTRLAICLLAGLAYGFGPTSLHLPAVLVPFALGVPARATRRGVRCAFAVVIVWTGAAALPAGLAALDYTGSPATALVAWGVPVAIVAAVLGTALAMPAAWRGPATVAALVAISVPPLSPFTLVSPLPVAGLPFPGLGAVGLVGFVLMLAATSVARSAPAVAVLVACGLGAAATAHAQASGRADPGTNAAFAGIDTHRGMPAPGPAALFGAAWRMAEHEMTVSAHAGTVLFPEGVYGEWRAAEGAILASVPARIVGGARIYVGGDVYVNVLVDGATGEIVYVQRRALPLDVGGAHRAVPGREGGVVAGDRAGAARSDRDPDRAGTASFRPAALICFELADPWLAATTFAGADGAVLWAANLGWAHGSGLYRRLVATAGQWSALFGKRVVTAVNHPERAGPRRTGTSGTDRPRGAASGASVTGRSAAHVPDTGTRVRPKVRA